GVGGEGVVSGGRLHRLTPTPLPRDGGEGKVMRILSTGCLEIISGNCGPRKEVLMFRFLKRFSGSSAARRALAHRPRCCRPALEVLQQRIVLSYSRPAVTTYWDGSFLQEHVWSVGSNDRHLYSRYYDSGGWHWSDHGTGGSDIYSDPAVTTYWDGSFL